MKVTPQVYHAAFAALTLGVSAFVAFGPLRHRLPRVLTRLAKYSMAFKLGMLGTVCGVMLWHNVRDEGPMAGRWVLTVLAVGFAAAAVRVLFLKAGGESA